MPRPVTPTGPPVLIVEDETIIRMNTVDVFEDAGFEVLEAWDGRTAVDLVRARRDLRAVVTDIDMPGEVSGYEVAHAARSECPSCLVVVVSGREVPMPGDLAAGARFVAKPYAAEDVVRMIETFVEQAGPR